MLGRVVGGKATPTYVSSDNDPLFEFRRWKANLSILDIKEIETVRIKDSAAILPNRRPIKTAGNLSGLITIVGNHVVVGSTSCRLQPEQEFAPHRS